MPCSNAAKTQNPLKFAGVPQTCQRISAASRPKFTVLRGRLQEILLLNFFVLANSNRTCGHSCKLFAQQCSLDVRKYRFANRVVEPWNHLPDHIVRASSVSLFRKLIDTVDLSGYYRY